MLTYKEVCGLMYKVCSAAAQTRWTRHNSTKLKQIHENLMKEIESYGNYIGKGKRDDNWHFFTFSCSDYPRDCLVCVSYTLQEFRAFDCYADEIVKYGAFYKQVPLCHVFWTKLKMNKAHVSTKDFPVALNINTSECLQVPYVTIPACNCRCGKYMKQKEKEEEYEAC